MKAFIEFGAAEDARRAVHALIARGYLDLETHGPFPLRDEDAHAPRGWFPAAFFAFGGGMFALVAAYAIQWYANVASYPLNIGGRPADAPAAFVPATFETICLFAVFALVVGFLFAERLPRLWQPIFEIDGFERASIDRFWIVLDLGRSTTVPEGVIRDVAPLRPVRMIVGEDRT